MNKKILILSLCVIFIIVASTIVLANFNNNTREIKGELNLNETTTIEESYVKIERNNIDADKYIKIANNYLTNLKITDKRFENTDTKIEFYQDNILSREEVSISNKDMLIKLESETGALLTYINQKTEFEKNEFSENEVKEKTLEIFKNVANVNEFEMILLEKFDEELYLAKFCKKYDNYINPGEVISISFAPQTSEIVTFTETYMPFANNNVEISNEDARQNAEQYLKKSVATDMEITLEIVMPNYGLNKALFDGRVYKSANQTRLAYICRFNNEAKTEIYIDATTGEAIGTSRILGE